MSKIIAVANQKGGVGKTTTALNLGAGLKEKGANVLLIDLDPQGNLSEYLGYEKDHNPTISELMTAIVNNQTTNIMDSIRKNPEGLDYIPSNIQLSSADYFLVTAMNREKVLSRILDKETLLSLKYDYVIIDCLPSLGILLINALACADSVIIPVQAQKFALDGLQDFLNIFTMVKSNINDRLTLDGIVLTMVEHTNMSKAVKEAIQEAYPQYVLTTEIRKSVEATNSSYEQKSLIQTKNSRLGGLYRELTSELLNRMEG